MSSRKLSTRKYIPTISCTFIKRGSQSWIDMGLKQACLPSSINIQLSVDKRSIFHLRHWPISPTAANFFCCLAFSLVFMAQPGVIVKWAARLYNFALHPPPTASLWQNGAEFWHYFPSFSLILTSHSFLHLSLSLCPLQSDPLASWSLGHTRF